MGGRDLMAGVATMTSREIAELTGSPHDSVLKTVRRLNAEGVVSGNETPYKHEQNGQMYYEYRMSFRDTMVVASGYSAELRAKIIDRWQELEFAAPAPIELSRLEILEIALASERKSIALAAQVAAQAPAVAFVDSYVTRSTGSLGFRAVAKLIGAKENAFRDFLKAEKILYQLGGAYHAYAQHLDAGRFEVRAGTTAGGIETKGHAFTQTMFTPKGVSWIAGEWAKHQISNRDGGAA